YNDGLVMPMALDRSTWVAAAPRRDRTLVVHSREYAETVAIRLHDEATPLPAPAEERLDAGAGIQQPPAHWTDYVRGVAVALGSSGADMLIGSDVPIGAGLSSSAALEVAVGYALLDLAAATNDDNAHIDRTALALACQRAEHLYVGTRCGVMDQMIACHGRSGHALML